MPHNRFAFIGVCSIAALVSSVVFGMAFFTNDVALTAEELETLELRLDPHGKLCTSEVEDCGAPSVMPDLDSPMGTGLSGKEIYDKFCFTCHDTGVTEAPLVGAEEWQTRLEQGADVLLQHTIEGYNNNLMPPRGTCNDCTNDELQTAIDYLIWGEETTEN